MAKLLNMVSLLTCLS